MFFKKNVSLTFRKNKSISPLLFLLFMCVCEKNIQFWQISSLFDHSTKTWKIEHFIKKNIQKVYFFRWFCSKMVKFLFFHFGRWGIKITRKKSLRYSQRMFLIRNKYRRAVGIEPAIEFFFWSIVQYTNHSVMKTNIALYSKNLRNISLHFCIKAKRVRGEVDDWIFWKTPPNDHFQCFLHFFRFFHFSLFLHI